VAVVERLRSCGAIQHTAALTIAHRGHGQFVVWGDHLVDTGLSAVQGLSRVEAMVFTASIATFFSISGDQFGIHDVWGPAAALLAVLIFSRVLEEEPEGAHLLFMRLIGVFASLSGFAWVALFLGQPIPL